MEGHGATNLFLGGVRRSGGSVALCLGSVQALLQLSTVGLDLVQECVDRRGSLGAHNFLSDEGNHDIVAAILLGRLNQNALEAAVLHVLSGNSGTAGVLHFLIAELHGGVAVAAEHAALTRGLNHTVDHEGLRNPAQQLLRGEVLLHLDALHQALARVDDANLRFGIGAGSLQDAGHLGAVLVNRREGQGEGRAGLVALGLDTAVLKAARQVLAEGGVQSLGAALDLVLVVLEVEGNLHGANTLIGAFEAKLGLNLRTAGAQNQGRNGQQNGQEHPALAGAALNGISQSLHTGFLS